VNRLRAWQLYIERRPTQTRRSRYLFGAVWLGFIAIPLITAFASRGSGVGHWLTVAGGIAFTLSYVWLVLIWFDRRSRVRAYALTAFQLALAVALTLHAPASWGFLFSYCAACVGLVIPSPYGFPVVLGNAVVAAGTSALGGSSGGTAFGYGVSAIGVGLLLTLLRDLNVRNDELQQARAELAETAVAAERERFARDLHDLLGHSLSVIAIKAELAGRLLPDRVDDAGMEIGDVERVARQALSEVRDAVSGYRQPTLAGELEGARVALAAAGIMAEFEHSSATLSPEVEAVLAWAVREGATNVIRHSGARHCQVRVMAGLADAAVVVVDDGSGGDAAPAAANGNAGRGHGLAGLSERAEPLRGRIEAGTLPGGGFRLAVSVPVSTAPA
jgi:two-component system sensor histidine kinase DesK